MLSYSIYLLCCKDGLYNLIYILDVLRSGHMTSSEMCEPIRTETDSTQHKETDDLTQLIFCGVKKRNTL